MNLLSKTGTLTMDMNRTNLCFNFNVPESVSKINVKFEYTPKTVEDNQEAARQVWEGLKNYGVNAVNAASFLPINNLVTMSFDDTNGFRGACHRHPNKQQICIANEKSTPGIINAPIDAGEWSAMINIHYVGCDVSYTLEIEGE